MILRTGLASTSNRHAGLRNSCGHGLAFRSSESPFARWPIRVEKDETGFTPSPFAAHFHAPSHNGISQPSHVVGWFIR
jgi:hypothetical protein